MPRRRIHFIFSRWLFYLLQRPRHRIHYIFCKCQDAGYILSFPYDYFIFCKGKDTGYVISFANAKTQDTFYLLQMNIISFANAKTHNTFHLLQMQIHMIHFFPDDYLIFAKDKTQDNYIFCKCQDT